MEGTPFGRYRLIELLGHGGMGDVWRAYDTETQRVVALKVLRAHVASDPQFEQRFRREAFAAAGLSDPHVVPIHSFGEIDGRLYVDMRLIEGRDLASVLQHGPLAPARAVKIVEQVASALHAAHRVGLLHRDVKPSNILITEYDFAYLIDFGIARGAGDSGLTGTGQVIGTFSYLAPERLTGGPEDSRADIYALACVLHECLTGAPPFPGRTMEQQIAGHISQPPPRPSVLRPGVPMALDAVIATGLAKNPNERYETTRALAGAAQSAMTAPVHQFAARPGPPPGRVIAPTAAPTQRRPVTAEPEPEEARNHRGPIAFAAIAGTFVLVIAISIITSIASGGSSDPAPSTIASPTTTTRPPNTGPFTGRYTADFGPDTRMGGSPYDGADPSMETWDVRSACRSTTCVATASRRSGSRSVPDLVFDQVGDTWVAVGIDSGSCGGDPPEDRFNTMILRPRPDGRLVGDYSYEGTGNCFGTATLTFTRTGDTYLDALPDPLTQPPRVVSPAEALHGQYHLRRDSTSGHDPQDYDYSVQTHCLRTGDRCMSLFHRDEGSVRLVFQNGEWTRNEEWDADGPACGASHVKITGTFSLPDPPQDPITQLTGRTTQEESGGRCTGSDFIETFQRTGD